MKNFTVRRHRKTATWATVTGDRCWTGTRTAPSACRASRTVIAPRVASTFWRRIVFHADRSASVGL
jgi:hypothetical protein